MEEIIRNYFLAWLNKDIETVQGTFAEDAIYSECYGPEYHGLSQILKWFEDWNKKGSVLEWSLKRVIEKDRTIIAEWFFKCDYEGTYSEFDGVTIADFDASMKIIKLCEFQSKAEHYYPYDT